jgi:hypothetical protein
MRAVEKDQFSAWPSVDLK